jgi:mannose-6-phosphate isomerase-like protein (cupin superfamily)
LTHADPGRDNGQVTEATGYVVAEQEVPTLRDLDDTARVKVTIDSSKGCERLEQRVIRFAPGRSGPHRHEGEQEVLYVAGGVGTLRLNGSSHALEPDTGAFVAAGESYEIENPGPDELLVVSVRTPAESGTAADRRRVTVRYRDQPALAAAPNREFRFLVNQDAGCLDVTQFVGVIPPGRAPDHSHTYDEVVYVVEGDGVLHLGGNETALSVGSCVHLPPEVVHSIENTGSRPMRVLGVFYPSGDPASRAAEDNN